MKRRQFLRAASAALILPAIVRAESIMRVKPFVTLDEVGDGMPLYSITHPKGNYLWPYRDLSD